MLNAYAPPFKLVVINFIFGIVYLFMPFFINLELALLHNFFAGFMLNIIIASLYQLSSVVYEKAICSIKACVILALVQNILCINLLFAFNDSNYKLWIFILLILSLFYFIYLFLRSFFIFKNIAQISLYLGVIFLAFGLICALIMALIFNAYLFIDFNFILNLHIYFMLGFIFFICIGAGSLLLPMFALTHNVSDVLLKISLISYLLAIFNFKISIFSICFFALWIVLILYKRARKTWDFWSINIAYTVFGLIVTCIFFMLNQLEYSIKSLIFASLIPFIIAHMYKILPFLIWFHFISKFAGKCKVPILSDLVLNKLALFTILINVILFVFIIFDFGYIKELYALFLLSIFVNVVNIFSFINYKGELDETRSS